MTRSMFISYDGAYPTLCFGVLKFKLDEKEYVWENRLLSGGSVSHDIAKGPWEIDFPSDFPEYFKPDVLAMVNDNVPWGCCGGCQNKK